MDQLEIAGSLLDLMKMGSKSIVNARSLLTKTMKLDYHEPGRFYK